MKNRIEREKETVEKMIRLYCKLEHKTADTCEDCTYLIGYTDRRLSKCPFGDDKPACNLCTVHCYRKDERETIRKIMRYSGPKMIFRHPYLAVMHIFDRKKSTITDLESFAASKNKS